MNVDFRETFCDTCAGIGKLPGVSICPACHGTGRIVVSESPKRFDVTPEQMREAAQKVADNLLEKIMPAMKIPDGMIQKALKNTADEMLEEVKKMEPSRTHDALIDFFKNPNIIIIQCPDCAGTGRVKWWWIFKRKCERCAGTGKNIEYKIPEHAEYARRIEYGKRV